MKTANFQYDTGRRKIYGKVTLKDDGKTSISLHDVKYGTCYMDRYHAKQLANAIVAADFVHPAIIGNVVSREVQGKLITLLFDQTKEFKEAFLNKTKEYATNVFNYAKKELKKPMEYWYDKFDVKWEMTAKHTSNNIPVLRPVSGEYSRRNIYRMEAKRKEYKEMIDGGYEKFEAQELSAANRHYEYSIKKLAGRLHDKGITDESKFEITSGRVEDNFECVIKHENGITRAWTIIAEGPIQRPHYRYLVK